MRTIVLTDEQHRQLFEVLGDVLADIRDSQGDDCLFEEDLDELQEQELILCQLLTAIS